MSAKIYTKIGDKGQTLLIGGGLVSKSLPRVDMYGELDELNSHLGLVIALLSTHKNKLQEEIHFLTGVQRVLFDLGALFACERRNWTKYKLPPFNKTLVGVVEQQIDKLSSKLPELTGFILPGGSTGASQLHVCRSVCRRVERTVVRFSQDDATEIPDGALQYINRLSDYLFVLARYVNLSEKGQEILK